MYGARVNQPTYPPPPPPSTQWNGKTNGFSIAALTLALIGCTGLLGIVFGVVGLNQSRRNGDQRGKVFAIAALSICGVWLLIIGVFVGFAVWRQIADGPDRDRNGAIRGQRSIAVTALRPGDCIKDLQAATGSYVDVLPCSSAHSSEVFATYDLPSGSTSDAAAAGCEQRFAAYAEKKKPDDAAFFLFSARRQDLGRDVTRASCASPSSDRAPRPAHSSVSAERASRRPALVETLSLGKPGGRAVTGRHDGHVVAVGGEDVADALPSGAVDESTPPVRAAGHPR